MAHKVGIYEGYGEPAGFDGYRRRHKKKHCRFGVAKSGRRKGQCLKNKRSRR